MERNFNEMFNKLKEHKGKFVQIYYYNYGYPSESAGELTDIVDFDYVEIEGRRYPFIGYGKAVKHVDTFNDEVLYENTDLDVCYNRTEPKDVIEAIRKSFGDEYANKEQARCDNLVKTTVEMKNEARQTKEIYVPEGLTVINPEKKDEWLIYANKLTDNYYTARIVKTLVEAMRNIENGVSFDKIDELVEKLDSNQVHELIGAIVHFSNYGEEYKTHCQNKYGNNFVKSIKLIVINKK